MGKEQARTISTRFGKSEVKLTVASPQNQAGTINVLDKLRDPEDFLKAGGNSDVHMLVNFGNTFTPLIGHYEDPRGHFANRDTLPDKGIVILADHVDEAKQVVQGINGMAERVFARPELYDDPAFCRDYYDLAAQGYSLIREHKSKLDGESGTPISLIRAGLVTTRLAQGLEPNAVVPNEVQVKTKRVHPKNGDEKDLMVTVEWMDREQIPSLAGANVDVADFVNPASGASTAAFVLAARHEGGRPERVVYSSIMATPQGIVFTQKSLRDIGVDSRFYTVGVSSTLDENYYLTNPGVGDAGRLLRRFQPQKRSND
jgi:uracil phosphoribosyltransferase